MAKNAQYRVPFRRRREGRTNYTLRRKLIRSNLTRAVVRVTNNHCLVQFVEARITGDNTILTAHSRELVKYNWNIDTSNIPSSYLTGYLAGLKAKSKKISNTILDIGVNPPIYGSRVFATLKGLIDAGVDIPHSDKIFPSEDRLNGTHIAEYAKLLQSTNDTLYNKQFSRYIKNKIDPVKIPDFVKKTKQELNTRK